MTTYRKLGEYILQGLGHLIQTLVQVVIGTKPLELQREMRRSKGAHHPKALLMAEVEGVVRLMVEVVDEEKVIIKGVEEVITEAVVKAMAEVEGRVIVEIPVQTVIGGVVEVEAVVEVVVEEMVVSNMAVEVV